MHTIDGGAFAFCFTALIITWLFYVVITCERDIERYREYVRRIP